MRSLITRSVYLLAIAVAMMGWSWLLMQGLAWAFTD